MLKLIVHRVFIKCLIDLRAAVSDAARRYACSFRFLSLCLPTYIRAQLLARNLAALNSLKSWPSRVFFRHTWRLNRSRSFSILRQSQSHKANSLWTSSSSLSISCLDNVSKKRSNTGHVLFLLDTLDRFLRIKQVLSFIQFFLFLIWPFKVITCEGTLNVFFRRLIIQNVYRL